MWYYDFFITLFKLLNYVYVLYGIWHIKVYVSYRFPGACPGFLKGGSNISWFPKKRSADFKGEGGPMV